MEELIFGNTPPVKHSVWDNYVPIVKAGRTTTVYLTDQIDVPSTYNELCYGLDSAYTGDETYMHINNGGGIIDSAFMLIDRMEKSKAKIKGILSGTVASASTVIALACDEIEVADHVQFMIHNYSGGTGGKGHEIKAYVNFSDKELNAAFRKLYKGFLTDKEMDEVIEGKDMWMGKDEVLRRWSLREAGRGVTDAEN